MRKLTRKESAARTRDELLDAAEEVFAEHGFGQTSLEQIARHAGYTRGAVYRNFTGKDELFLAVLDRWLDNDIEHGRRINAGDVGGALSSLRELAGNRFADRSRYLLLAEFRLYALRNPAVAGRLAEHERRTRAWYATEIDRQARGLPVDPDRLALYVLALENGIATLAHLDPDTVDQHAFVDALELIVNAAQGSGSS
ncbi:TetR/AcrR family transcriptional regulator [Amycolatopsis suaedae]|uniref:TetR/AcrR family transcriptional regulator n=1 Tax=Amycolatopsis suaedae TaxID=2510978 RepID=A0A4Q7JFN5_9PSEU|nr:TetR/AcrR family transcriptional regulator [Amycolatopsis suaedae]RZQ66042.1 TetR/AcrR family transcriptional regulator [Amycolatopsis suaedae]